MQEVDTLKRQLTNKTISDTPIKGEEGTDRVLTWKCTYLLRLFEAYYLSSEGGLVLWPYLYCCHFVCKCLSLAMRLSQLLCNFVKLSFHGILCLALHVACILAKCDVYKLICS